LNFEYFAIISGAKNVFFVWSPKIFLSQKLAKKLGTCTIVTVKTPIQVMKLAE